jgi:hypothetical protein
MSTIHSYGALRPNRLDPFLRHLVALLAIDAARRVPPPISLPGRPADSESIALTPPPAVERVHSSPRLMCDARIYRSKPGDARGPYDRDRLLHMNARFVARLERAFANGAENRGAASATYWNGALKG